jgi:hypothetical protein
MPTLGGHHGFDLGRLLTDVDRRVKKVERSIAQRALPLLEGLPNVGGGIPTAGQGLVYDFATQRWLSIGPSQWFSLPGTSSSPTGNCPARYAQVVDGGIGTLKAVQGTDSVITVTILDHTGATLTTFTHTIPAGDLINAGNPTTGVNYGPLVVDSDMINVACSAPDVLFELRYL